MPVITGEDYAAAKIELTVFDGFAVFDCGILPHDKQAIASNAATTGSTGGHAAVDHAAVHDELAVFPWAAAVCFHTAAAVRNAADDGTSVHGEYAVRITALNHHTAACAVGLTAHDAAAVHGELAAVFNQHTAAVGRVVHFCTRAAVDDAALDGLRAVGLIQHPQAVGVGSEFMLRGGVAVDDCQVAAVLDLKDAAAGDFAHFQRMTVEVNGDCIIDPQGTVKLNVAYQRDGADLSRHFFIQVELHLGLVRADVLGCDGLHRRVLPTRVWRMGQPLCHHLGRQKGQHHRQRHTQ